MSRKISALALLSDRKSNNTQVISVANQIAKNGTLYKKKIIFNVLINIPFIWKFLPIWLAVGKNDGFNDIENVDVIITCGAKSVLYAIYLKKKSFPNVKIVQILKPEFLYKEIDVVLLPDHDRKMIYGNNKVLRYLGSLTLDKNEDLALISNDNDEDLELFSKDKDNIIKIIESMSQPIIGVYIGGNSKHCYYKDDAIEEFAERVSKIANNMNASLLITSSRRTNIRHISLLKKHLNCNYYFYEYNDTKYNPYSLFLKYAHYHIVTGDSISMISDLIATSNPVYIYTEAAKSKKYFAFHNAIFKKNTARELTRDTQILEKFEIIKLNDIEKLSEEILQFIGY